ncbi:MAG: hypothetical protein E6J78_20795, partial [Deltaproteobacteria bacterium]
DFRQPDGNCASGAPCSRATMFSIDEQAKTATLVWQHDVGVYAPFIGSIQVLPGGHVEYDIGTFGGAAQARVQEVTMDDAANVVWQLDVADSYVYRAFRIPSLYPGVQW